MKSFYRILFIANILLSISCTDNSEKELNNPSQTLNDDTWTVPINDILGNFNPFPEITNPTLTPINEVENLNDDSTVAIVSFDDTVKIYPLSKIHNYEAINDQTNNNLFTVSYCPITESVININRKHNDNTTFTFRASGFLYKENLVMLDSKNDSYWSQMLLQCIKGPFANSSISNLNLVETNWKTAKKYLNNAVVFTDSSISSKIENTNISFKSEEEIHNDERVFGVINKLNSKDTFVYIYRYSNFNEEIKLYNNVLNNNTIVVGSQSLHFITAFLNEKNYSFEVVQNEFPIILKDSQGNKWNVFGKAISGPNEGEYLKPTKGFIAAWWAWEEFYQNFNFIE